MRKIILTFLMTLVPVALFGQLETFPAGALVPGASFITALVVGIILAFGFQLILMNLSAAAGLSALHSPLESVRKKVRSGGARGHEEEHEESEPIEEKMRTVNTTFGIWAIVTSSISLFFAAWLAVEFSTALTVISGLTLGLAIWGLFYIVSAILEMTAVSSMVGSLMDVVRSGFRTVTEATSGIFGRSEERQASETTRSIINAVRTEVFGDVNAKKAIQSYIDQVKPGYRELGKEIESILDNAEIEIHASPSRDTLTARFHIVGAAAAAASKTKETARAARGVMGEEARSDKERAEKIADASARMAGMSREDAEKYRHQVEDYLARTGKEELNPEGIKRDIDKLVSDPKAGVDAILSRLNDMDRSTITSILAQRKDMNQDEARRVVDMVAGTVNSLKSRYQAPKEPSQGAAWERPAGMTGRAHDILDSTDNPEISYDAIKADFETMLHDPRAGASSLIHRLKTIDRNDIKHMVARSNPNMNEEDAERMVSRIEGTRDDMISRAEKMRSEVNARVKQAEETALYHAEETRKVASSAAWWVFAAALVSGVAAAAGGMVAIVT
jgi:hypothetical protein